MNNIESSWWYIYNSYMNSLPNNLSNALLAIADCILADRLHAFIDSTIPDCPGVFTGARPHTQCLDITHAMQLVVERANDNRAEGAVGQMDILKVL